MTSLSSTSVRDAHIPAYRVESPRASDALSVALRNAYARELGLPDDMAALLGRLNRLDLGSAH